MKRIPLIVFTGAGASRAKPIELPTMKEFFEQIMNTNREPTSRRISNKSYFQFIFDTLYAEESNYDLERVMGALYDLDSFTNNDCWKISQHPKLYDNIESALKINKVLLDHPRAVPIISKAAENTYNEYRNNAKTLIRELEDLIREKYEIVSNKSIRIVYEPLFDLLITLFNNVNDIYAKCIPFFTTNYDMSIDWFFKPDNRSDRPIHTEWAKNRFTYIDGFIDNEWDSIAYKEINEDANVMQIPYFKLHGSLFWERRAGSIRRTSSVARDIHLNQELVIIYPSDKKVLTEDPFYFNQQMLDYYLRRADNLLIIGFSFRDPLIVQSFQYALASNEKLKITIANPAFDPEGFPELDEFIEKNQERVIHQECYFGENTFYSKIQDNLSFIENK